MRMKTFKWSQQKMHKFMLMMLLMREIDDDDDDVQKVKCKIVVQNWNFLRVAASASGRRKNKLKSISFLGFLLSNLFITHVAFSAWLSLIFLRSLWCHHSRIFCSTYVWVFDDEWNEKSQRPFNWNWSFNSKSYFPN